MDTELAATRARLEGLSIGHSTASAAPASEEAPLAGSEEAGRPLELVELQPAATARFVQGRLIGRRQLTDYPETPPLAFGAATGTDSSLGNLTPARRQLQGGLPDGGEGEGPPPEITFGPNGEGPPF